MHLQEAYRVLDLPQTATPEEAKKKYRELVKQNHPDINKDPGAEDKIKKVNEAYQCIQNGKGNDREMAGPSSWYSNPFNIPTQKVIRLEHIEIHLTVDFKESILGCKKDVKYARQAKCANCEGAGQIRLNNGCAKCGGKGQTTTSQRGMVFVITCGACHGRVNIADCSACHGEGFVHTDVSVNVSVPPGVSNGNVLRLQGMGNYAGQMMGFMEQYTDVFCHIAVGQEPGLRLEGQDVVCSITITLLEALQGCNKTVKTIFGEQEVQINPQSRNREEIVIPKFGVAGTGNQRVILDVPYPDDIGKIIDALTNKDVPCQSP